MNGELEPMLVAAVQCSCAHLHHISAGNMNYAAPVNDSEPGDTYTGHKCRLPFRSTAGRAGNLGQHSDRKLIVAANAGHGTGWTLELETKLREVFSIVSYIRKCESASRHCQQKKA